MASMFKKPKRNFRRKVADSDSDQENEDHSDNKCEEFESMELEDVLSMEEASSASNSSKSDKFDKKKKKREKEKPGAALLSFGDDEEGDSEVIRVKKSSHSKRIAKMLKREHREMKEGTGVAEEKDRAENGRKEQKERSQKSDEEEEERRAAERIQRLREEFRTLNGEEAEEAEECDEEGRPTFRHRLKHGEIPDAQTIHMIRKQRQRAREHGDDFIPLEEAAPEKKAGSSRLVRDDENDRSDDEEDRINFTVNKAAAERQQMRDDFLAAEHGSDEDSDQDKEWEKQQINKAVNMSTVTKADLPSNENSSSSPLEHVGLAHSGAPLSSFKPLDSMSRSQDLSQVTIEVVRRRLQDRLKMMDEVHRGHKMELERLVREIDDCETESSQCSGKSEQLENQFRFFQEMRGYVRDLVECLNEKVPTISDLETRLMNLLAQRAERLLQRRQQDVRDQCQDYMTSKAAVPVSGNLEDQARQRRVAEREARRARRRRAREAKNITSHNEGLSSDDEENQSEMTKFNLEKEDITRAAEELMEDVVDDFSNIRNIREQFEAWKFQYGDLYRDAYIGLCIPKLLTPFVRLQLLDWNPLEENCKDFEDMSWYNNLIFFGVHRESEMTEVDDDIKIIPSIIEKVLLPKLTSLVEKVWDPLSTTQTSRLVNLMHRLVRDYPSVQAENKATQTLLKAITDRMKKTLDDDVFMPMYPKTVLDNRSSGPAVFFHRQAWTCIKLLGNILSWHGLLATSVLQQLAFNGLLNRYIILALMNSHIDRQALNKCQAIISTFPKVWFSELEGDKTLPQMENLCRYLVQAAGVLHTSTASAPDFQRKEGREHIKQISKLLVMIHAMDHAIQLSNQYSFKIP